MDDLSSLDWNSTAPPTNRQPSGPKGNYFPILQPTPPTSGRSTPSAQLSTSLQKPFVKSSTPASDSFASLVSFNTTQPAKSLSLQEQQKIIQEQKRKQEDERRAHVAGPFAPKSVDPALLDTLGSGRSTPSLANHSSTHAPFGNPSEQSSAKSGNGPFSPPFQSSSVGRDEEDDILAAFNSSAPVDRSSHMPTPPSNIREDMNERLSSQVHDSRGNGSTGLEIDDLEDDPFGLRMKVQSKRKGKSPGTANGVALVEDTDDVLGLLGKPVSEFPTKRSKEQTIQPPDTHAEENPQARAVMEMFEMGFPAERSRKALETTDSGLDVQAAVGWLLNQAHEDSRAKTRRQRIGDAQGHRQEEAEEIARKSVRQDISSSSTAKPAWMREVGKAPRRQEDRSPARADKDPSQYASEIGNTLFKTANSLWKTGTKKLNQAVSDLNGESDPSHPRWMREASKDNGTARPKQRTHDQDMESAPRQRQAKASLPPPTMTDEALLLESGASRPSRKLPIRSDPIAQESPGATTVSRTARSATRQTQAAAPAPIFVQKTQYQDPRSKLTRQNVEEEASQAYISPARRKKAMPKSPGLIAEPDLLFADTEPAAPSHTMVSRTSSPQAKRPSLTPRPSPPPAPKRSIPTVAPHAAENSTRSRQAGTAAFKRGDYAEATLHYSAAASTIPLGHPLLIPILTNRALSQQKTGDPKASMTDAVTIIDLIGPSRGAGENIDLGGDEGIKPMEPYWGKAMMRKAEALEQLERYADAAEAWRICVAAGVGGAMSIAGRNRSENASRPKPKPSTVAKRAPPRPKPSALSDLGAAPAASTEAVSRLRAANAAAEKLDDEKFALADAVDARVAQWRSGKEANLRALLASLENVLWTDAGWKKVGMGELIQPNKVKIVYMKGIAKVHPDKVSQ